MEKKLSCDLNYLSSLAEENIVGVVLLGGNVIHMQTIVFYCRL